MKLIDREPTPEMLFAARFYKEGQHTLACAWRAMYGAAPEVNGQAEIAKRDARIKELEERRCEICGYAEHHREHKGCLRVFVKEQAAEISRLKKVIVDLRFLQNINSTQEAEIQRLEAVSKEAKEAIELFLEQYPHMAKGYLIDALAAIKEEGL